MVQQRLRGYLPDALGRPWVFRSAKALRAWRAMILAHWAYGPCEWSYDHGCFERRGGHGCVANPHGAVLDAAAARPAEENPRPKGVLRHTCVRFALSVWRYAPALRKAMGSASAISPGRPEGARDPDAAVLWRAEGHADENLARVRRPVPGQMAIAAAINGPNFGNGAAPTRWHERSDRWSRGRRSGSVSCKCA